MSVPSLAVQAGKKIPLNALFFATEPEGNVINQVFINSIAVNPKLCLGDLRHLCKTCNQNGDCLCYLFRIRHMMMDIFWAQPHDYFMLQDWLRNQN